MHDEIQGNDNDIYEAMAPLYSHRRYPSQQMIGNLHDRITHFKFNDLNLYVRSTLLLFWDPNIYLNH